VRAVGARPHRAGGPVVAAGTALALILTAFFAAGGLRVERTAWVEAVLTLAGAGLVALALLVPGRRSSFGRLHGGLTVLGFAALAAVTALSITWSLTPSDSWLETSRTVAYLAVLAGGVALARLAPGAWWGLLAGIAIASLVVCGWALATKVFPGALAPDETYARLRNPFGYWNAVGLMAALGMIPLLWLAARRSGQPALNALAWPGLGLLLVCLMLAYSRGALLALLVGIAVWLLVVPLRLRAAVALICTSLVAAPVIAWTFSREALTNDRVDLASRTQEGHSLGALLLLMAVTLLAAGLVVGFASARRPPSPRVRVLAGRSLLAALAVVVVGAVVAVAAAPGGLSGQVSETWDQLTNPAARTPANTPDRLTAASSVRARYWKEALEVHGTSPLTGTGAGAYATVRTRFRTDQLAVQHAHGYVVQTLADLGWLGLGVSLLALVAWLVAAARAIGLRPRDRGLPWDAERVGVATLAVVALTFGVHSAVDWTWFVPANAAAGLLAAGWVAGRGPLRERLARAAAPRAWRPGDGWRTWRPARGRVVAAVVVLALGLTGAWSALQPVRALNAGDEVFARIDRNELDAAADIARTAAARNPLSPEPLWELALVEQLRGNNFAAERALEDAVKLEPATAETWRRLGRLQLSVLNEPDEALDSFRAALYLDPRQPASTSDFLEASRAANAG